jgi:hypothetical protein
MFFIKSKKAKISRLPIEKIRPPVEKFRPPVEKFRPPVEKFRPPVEKFRPSKTWVLDIRAMTFETVFKFK